MNRITKAIQAELDEVCRDMPVLSLRQMSKLSNDERVFYALVRTRIKPYKATGICHNVGAHSKETAYIKLRYTFPVPAPRDSGLIPGKAYHCLPKWDGEYGANRRRLLDKLIIQYANKVNKVGDK